MRLKGILNVPSYNLTGPFQSVQHSLYTLIYPGSMKIDWKAYGIDLVPVTKKKDGIRTLTMEVNNWPAQPYEESAGPPSKQFPYVLFHTNNFKYDDYPGDMSSWNSLGLWLYKLNESTNDLSEANKAEIQKLVAGISKKEDQVKILYSYLNKTSGTLAYNSV